jgi:hypothetical protein
MSSFPATPTRAGCGGYRRGGSSSFAGFPVAAIRLVWAAWPRAGPLVAGGAASGPGFPMSAAWLTAAGPGGVGEGEPAPVSGGAMSAFPMAHAWRHWVSARWTSSFAGWRRVSAFPVVATRLVLAAWARAGPFVAEGVAIGEVCRRCLPRSLRSILAAWAKASPHL